MGKIDELREEILRRVAANKKAGLPRYRHLRRGPLEYDQTPQVEHPKPQEY
jgi:hypothetical protein